MCKMSEVSFCGREVSGGVKVDVIRILKTETMTTDDVTKGEQIYDGEEGANHRTLEDP